MTCSPWRYLCEKHAPLHEEDKTHALKLLPKHAYESLRKNLLEARFVYDYMITLLPDAKDLPDRFGILSPGGMANAVHHLDRTFTPITKEGIQCAHEELGWAFYCRLENIGEHWMKGMTIRLTHDMGLQKWLKTKGIAIPDKWTPALELRREIRNNIIHEDGADIRNKKYRPNRVEGAKLFISRQDIQLYFDFWDWVAKQTVCQTCPKCHPQV